MQQTNLNNTTIIVITHGDWTNKKNSSPTIRFYPHHNNLPTYPPMHTSATFPNILQHHKTSLYLHNTHRPHTHPPPHTYLPLIFLHPSPKCQYHIPHSTLPHQTTTKHQNPQNLENCQTTSPNYNKPNLPPPTTNHQHPPTKIAPFPTQSYYTSGSFTPVDNKGKSNIARLGVCNGPPKCTSKLNS